MIKYVTGDVFTQESKVIAHGCNCRGVMGAGIAAQVARRWPDLEARYRQACAAGHFQLGGGLPYETADGWLVYNLATQYFPGADARRWAIASAIGGMISHAIGKGVTAIGMPQIGCGIGGLSTDDLWTCLAPYKDAPVTLTVYEYTPPVLDPAIVSS